MLIKRCNFRSELFKALSNPVRIQMLELLRERAWCVCELADAVGIGKSVASKHLSQMKAVGIIDDKRSGTMVEYRLVAPCLLNLMTCAEETIIKNKLAQLESMQNITS